MKLIAPVTIHYGLEKTLRNGDGQTVNLREISPKNFYAIQRSLMRIAGVRRKKRRRNNRRKSSGKKGQE